MAVESTRPQGAPAAARLPRRAGGGFIGLVTRLFTEKPLGAVGAVIVMIMLLMAVFANWIAPYPYDEPHFSDSLQGSSLSYFLGTDFIGRDLFSRLVHGARVSIVVALGSVTLGSILAGLIGITSGYMGGKFDTLMQRLVDAWMSVPPLLLLLFVMSILGPSTLNVTLVLGLVAIRESRVLRGAVLALKEQPFVEAARVNGATTLRILIRHVLPNVMVPIIILASLRLGQVILIEASLSFLGYGVPPPFPSWGRMLSSESRTYMEIAPWLAIWPGVFLSLTVFGWNVLGDALRDLLDPRMRGTGGGYRSGS
ncbi:MAG: ABC transporter permease [Chloroflexi bacterium]|nr:ABC transporter permease [Chloroflexota bacterium]